MSILHFIKAARMLSKFFFVAFTELCMGLITADEWCSLETLAVRCKTVISLYKSLATICRMNRLVRTTTFNTASGSFMLRRVETLTIAYVSRDDVSSEHPENWFETPLGVEVMVKFSGVLFENV